MVRLLPGKVGDLKGTAAQGGRNAGGRIKGNEDKQSVCLERVAFSEYVCVSDGETWSHVYANLPLGAASNMSAGRWRTQNNHHTPTRPPFCASHWLDE